jgi:hypothetical protein
VKSGFAACIGWLNAQPTNPAQEAIKEIENTWAANLGIAMGVFLTFPDSWQSARDE